MSKDPLISELWTAIIYYKGKSGRNKPRPVLVVVHDEADNLFTIQEITSEEPKEPLTYFQQCKELIKKWDTSGLDEKSYVKCSPTNTHKVSRDRLHKYIGTLHEEDFENTINKMVVAKANYKVTS